MKRLASALIFFACASAALGQATPPPSLPANAAPAAEGARQSVPSTATPGAASAAQPPQRGFIAPVIDIRIQGEGIGLPKPAAAAPAVEPEKPAPAAK